MRRRCRSRTARRSGGITRGADGPGAEGVPRRRRHRRRHRAVDGAGRAPAPADHERAGDADADRGPAAEAGGVLRPRLGAAGTRGPSQPLAWGMPAQADVYFDNSPVFRLGPDAASRGRDPDRLVRLAGAAAQRLGLGPALSRRRGRDRRAASAKGGWSCAARRSRSAPSRTGRSSSCSTRCASRSTGVDCGARRRVPIPP